MERMICGSHFGRKHLESGDWFDDLSSQIELIHKRRIKTSIKRVVRNVRGPRIIITLEKKTT